MRRPSRVIGRVAAAALGVFQMRHGSGVERDWGPFCAFCGSAADDDDVVSARVRSNSTAYVDAVMQTLANAGNYWREASHPDGPVLPV